MAVVDLVSPDGAERAARSSFGSCVSETPSPEASTRAGGGSVPLGMRVEDENTRGGGGEGTATGVRRLAASCRTSACPITGLSITEKLPSQLQSSAQVTASTLRSTLANVIGWRQEDISSEWSRDTLIRKYHCALKEQVACSTVSESRSPKTPALAACGVQQHAARRDDDCRRSSHAANFESGRSCVRESVGISVQAEGLWNRLERKREQQEKQKESEDVERDLPLWQRLEARRKRELWQDSSDSCDEYAERRESRTASRAHLDLTYPSARASSGPLPKKAKIASTAEHLCAGSDSDDSIADLTSPSYPAASMSATAAAARLVEQQVGEKVARLLRERDAQVRRQTAAAVEALDFERAAIVKRTVDADFEQRISALKNSFQGSTAGNAGGAARAAAAGEGLAPRGSQALGGRPVGGDACEQKKTKRRVKGASDGVGRRGHAQGAQKPGGKEPAEGIGDGVERGGGGGGGSLERRERGDGVPAVDGSMTDACSGDGGLAGDGKAAYAAMSVGALKKIMSR